MTQSPIIVAKPFDDRDGDNIINFYKDNLVKYRAELGGAKEVGYKLSLSSEGRHVYWPIGYEPKPEAPSPPVTDNPAIRLQIALYLRQHIRRHDVKSVRNDCVAMMSGIASSGDTSSLS